MIAAEACLLLVAAEAREFAGLLSHCRGIRKLDWPVQFARQGEMRERPMVMVSNGAGPANAATALEVARDRLAAGAVLSTGFCGALDPEYRIGDVFVATSLLMDSETVQIDLPECDRTFRRGTLLSVDRVAQTVEEKRALRDRGASAVEMEAAGVARLVRQWELPLFCIRVVTDRAGEGFALDLNSARLPDGRFSTRRILASAIRRPAAGIPELFRLYRRSRIAAQSLGDFIADCRF